ncbi:MAG: Gfo/Idh/MocA family oxidoreductase [Gammaproteobacteria bacterium]|nr:Gfo/Idh/MocA family oxidoreductase [Gammaproteobacteria bacterium]
MGFGRLAQDYYVPAMQAIPNVQVTGVVDPLAKSLAQARVLLPEAQSETDLDGWLRSAALDALVVATPPSQHLSDWRSACNAGLPVFMEKPFPLPNEVSQLTENEPWDKLMVNFNRRFWPGYLRVKELIEEQRALGTAGAAHATIRLRTNAAKWSTVTTHRFDEQEGGALCDLGYQATDLATHLFSQSVKAVQAARTGAGPDEAVSMKLVLVDDTVVDCEVGYGDTNSEQVIVRTARGEIRSDNPNYLVWHHTSDAAIAKALRRAADFGALAYRGFFRNRSMLRYSVYVALRRFVDSVRHAGTMTPGFHDAVRVAVAIGAAQRSISTGEIVTVPQIDGATQG